jgi:hypothetical protein
MLTEPAVAPGMACFLYPVSRRKEMSYFLDIYEEVEDITRVYHGIGCKYILLFENMIV